jgi:hypothetical protein
MMSVQSVVSPEQEVSLRQALFDGMSPGWFFARVLWVVVQLVLAYWCVRSGDLFFYQGF